MTDSNRDNNLKNGIETEATPSLTPSHESNQNWKKNLPTSIRLPILSGFLIVALFIGGFVIWGATVPISGAVVANGIVAASGLNQKVDHLEGGIIEEILVAEGDTIKDGQALIKLDSTRALSERNRVRGQLVGLKAKLTRTRAERDGLENLFFDQALTEEAKKLGLEDDLKQQQTEFSNRQKLRQSQLLVYEQRSQAINDEISGLKIQISSEETKLAVIRDELAQKKELLDRGLTQRSQFNALQRAEADSQGKIGGLTATIAQRKTSLLEIEKQLASLEAETAEKASAESNAIQLQVNDLEEQIDYREAALSRTTIRSPIEGIVVKLNKNTVGSAVGPGETVLEILPTTSDFIIEAKVLPQDIDLVRPGLDANVRFVALNARTTPEMGASVTYVSADRLVDPDSRNPFFLARLELAGELPKPLTRDQIYPGMPVDAFIGTGDRTFFEYLFRPIVDSFSKAFREE